jgi:uroporphyrinogen III methyltransferase/synthase
VFKGLQALAGEQAAGTVSLVGAGPGDVLLISVKGAVRLSQADVILYDGLLSEQLLEMKRDGAEAIFVGKRRGQAKTSQDQINAMLIAKARDGLRVVRLKSGDPFVFGRGGEECEALAAAGISFEVVPGITAAVAAPAYAGIPMTHRGVVRTFAVVTGHDDPADDVAGVDFAALAKMGTVAFYMGLMNLEANCRRLIEAGMDPRTPAAAIQSGTRAEQRTVEGTLATIHEKATQAKLQPPVVTLIGCTVGLREKLNWFETLPLFGRRVLITRAKHQAASLAGPLAALGAEVIAAPTIAVRPMEDYGEVDAALRGIEGYDWLILTSGNGVEATFNRLAGLGLDARALAGVKVAAIGTATADRLKDFCIHADLIPEAFVAETLAAELRTLGIQGKRCLMLRADIARSALKELLEAVGASCDDLAVYRTAATETLDGSVVRLLDEGKIDWVTLTSSSTFANLVNLLGAEAKGLLAKTKLASIGPITSATIRDASFEPTVEAGPHTVEGLIAAIRQHEGR